MLPVGLAFPLAALAVGGIAGAFLVTPAQHAVKGPVRFGRAIRLLAAVVAAALFAVVAWRLEAEPSALPVLLLVAAGVVLSLVDLAEKRLPNRVLGVAAIVVGAGLLVAVVVEGDWGRLLPAALGAVALFAIYFVLALLSPRGLGMGDVKLSALLGLVLGWFGWDTWLIGLVAGFLAGAVVSLIALALRRVTRTSLLPFGPSMLVGALLAIVLG
ncbi:A24 family peptidase [Naasia sp. SYSU D00948]|uniref:prepilin peptidase n=1 Tax=Naasia sp. SYSU D00948 TaxID=2817379 RepID=UPI001B304C23|nr:A24 family peptidase [Naasia sp. SYSU D00948]